MKVSLSSDFIVLYNETVGRCGHLKTLWTLSTEPSEPRRASEELAQHQFHRYNAVKSFFELEATLHEVVVVGQYPIMEKLRTLLVPSRMRGLDR